MNYRSSTTVRMRYIEEHNEWQKLHNHQVNGKYPILMVRIPNCENFHSMYPGCEFDKDNIFQCININISQGEKRMPILGSTGKRTHIHALGGWLCTVAEIYGLTVICQETDINIGWVILLGAVIVHLCNISGAQGTTRWTLKKLEDK